MYRLPDSPSRASLVNVATLIVVSIVLLLVLLTTLIWSDWLHAVDQRLSASVQQIRSPLLDRIMIGVTMLADTKVSLVGMGLVVLLLGASRQWWLALHVAAVFFAVRLTVILIKVGVDRPRPSSIYDGADVFSFPSGHASAAAALFGVVALVAWHQRPSARVDRYVTLSLLCALTVAVAFSRVYLLAHWPSDVLASLLLVAPFLATVHWQLSEHLWPVSWLLPGLLAGLVMTFLLYLIRAWDIESLRYAVSA